MKDYYNTKIELENKKERAQILKHDINDIELKLNKITGSIEEKSSVKTGMSKSKIHEYIVEKIAKEEELEKLEKEILYIEPILVRMEKRIKEMNGIHREIFEMVYIMNMKPKYIAQLKNYSVQRIYQLINEVNDILEIDKDYKKF